MYYVQKQHSQFLPFLNADIIVGSLKQLLNHPWVIGDLAKEELMDPEVVSRLQSFNARRKLRAAAIASVWSSTIFLRTKKLRSLLGSHDLTPEELDNLRMNFKKMQVNYPYPF